MPTLNQNVLYKGRILKAGTKLNASQAKKFGEHVLESDKKTEAETEDTSSGDKGNSEE